MPWSAPGTGTCQRLTRVILRPDQTSLPEVSPKTARTGYFHRRNLVPSSKAISVATLSRSQAAFSKNQTSL